MTDHFWRFSFKPILDTSHAERLRVDTVVLNCQRDRGERGFGHDREGGLAVPRGGRWHGGEDIGRGDGGSDGPTVDLHALPEEPDGDDNDEPPSS